MQDFIDTKTQALWAFEDDVLVSKSGGVYFFATDKGIRIVAPSTLQPYVAPTPTPEQIAAQQAAVLAAQALSALNAGLEIVSSATPAINGTYACDQLSQMDIIAIETSLNAGRGFPGGAATINYPDVTGTMRAFTEANFTNFATAIRDYVYALRSVIAGASLAMPAATATIA